MCQGLFYWMLGHHRGALPEFKHGWVPASLRLLDTGDDMCVLIRFLNIQMEFNSGLTNQACHLAL